MTQPKIESLINEAVANERKRIFAVAKAMAEAYKINNLSGSALREADFAFGRVMACEYIMEYIKTLPAIDPMRSDLQNLVKKRKPKKIPA